METKCIRLVHITWVKMEMKGWEGNQFFSINLLPFILLLHPLPLKSSTNNSFSLKCSCVSLFQLSRAHKTAQSASFSLTEHALQRTAFRLRNQRIHEAVWHKYFINKPNMCPVFPSSPTSLQLLLIMNLTSQGFCRQWQASSMTLLWRELVISFILK